MKLFFLTGPEFPAGHPDDQKLFAAARAFAEPVWLDWHSPTGPGRGDLVLIRTPWDYQTDPYRFLRVLEGIEKAGALLANPFATVQWNLDKIYMTELADVGVDIVPTHAFARPLQDLSEFRVAWGNGEWILKPRIGASASGVLKVKDTELDRIVTAGFAETPRIEHVNGQRGAGTVQVSLQDLLLQPMIASVRDQGEVSLIYYRIDGEAVFSHASLKVPKAGDFRVQVDWGGTDAAYSPAGELIATGAAWLSKLDKNWSYARVDILEYAGPRPFLGEVELIEPQLFHRFGARSEELCLRALGFGDRLSN